MKKLLMILLTICLVSTMIMGCTPNNTSAPEQEPEEQGSTTTPDDEVKGDGAVALGLGSVTSIGKSKDYNVSADGKETLAVGQVDTVIAAATFDKDGKVVAVSFDTAQTKVNFDKDMKVTSDKAAEYKTKKELGDEYGMKGISGIGKEWFEQIEALEDWMVGKTVDEIKAMKVTARDESHPAVPDVPELTSSVTITVQDYIAALEKASQNTVAVEGAAKLGLGHTVSIGKSKDYSLVDGKETLPMAQVDTVMAATAFDENGVVVGTLIDNAQIKVNFDAEGKVTSDKAAEYKTKKELGNEYGMKGVSGIGKEWFEQIEALEDWMVGKTADEIKGMKVKAKDESHPAVPDVAELTSSVTISVQDYIAAVAEAYTNAQ